MEMEKEGQVLVWSDEKSNFNYRHLDIKKSHSVWSEWQHDCGSLWSFDRAQSLMLPHSSDSHLLCVLLSRWHILVTPVHSQMHTRPQRYYSTHICHSIFLSSTICLHCQCNRYSHRAVHINRTAEQQIKLASLCGIRTHAQISIPGLHTARDGWATGQVHRQFCVSVSNGFRHWPSLQETSWTNKLYPHYVWIYRLIWA